MNQRHETLAHRRIVTCAGFLTQHTVPYSLTVRGCDRHRHRSSNKPFPSKARRDVMTVGVPRSRACWSLGVVMCWRCRMVSCTDCEHPCNQWCADEVDQPNAKHRKDSRSRQSRRSLLEAHGYPHARMIKCGTQSLARC